MNFKENKKKYLLYGLIIVLLVLSFFMYKTSSSANSEDNKITIKNASITSVVTGAGSFDSSDNAVIDGEGNMTSWTAGTDSSATNRLIRSNDILTYNIDLSIKGKNDDNPYYSRTVNVTVELSEEEAKFISFDQNGQTGETSHTFLINNVSSTSNTSCSITLFVLNGANGKEIAPKFIIKESTDTDSGIVIGKNGSNIEYSYENGAYTSTNQSPFENFMPTVVSSNASSGYNIELVNTSDGNVVDGQKALYENQSGRFYTGVLVVSVPNTKGTYVDTTDITLPISITHESGDGNPTIDESWIRLYDRSGIDAIDPVALDAPYSVGNGGTAGNETRYPGTVTYSGGNIVITGIKDVYSGPTAKASGQSVGQQKVLGTYAISFFSPRVASDGKNDVIAKLNVGGYSVTFTNHYTESSDYNLKSGFYDENGNERLTTYINEDGAVKELNSSTSKGDSITYRTDFKYKKTMSNTGVKEVIKLDPRAFRVIPKSDKEDIDIDVICGSENCPNISKDNFDIKFVTKSFSADNYDVNTSMDSRISSENMDTAVNGCANINLAAYDSDQIMNLYGGPCIKEKEEVSYNKINDARNEQNDEIPITKVIVQTKEGVNLPDDAKVVVKVYLRVRNVSDITRSYQGTVTISTSDSDSELYYYAPSINGVIDPNNYIRSTFNGSDVKVNSVVSYADSIRIVNFTARQNITVTNKTEDGQVKTRYDVDDNETIKFKVSTKIEDMNERVGADDVWYFKSMKVYVDIPSGLDYIPDSSLLTPEVSENGGTTTLVYTLPWSKPNMKIDDIYFKAKLNSRLTGSGVPLVVKSRFEPVNINGEVDMSEINAKNGIFTLYGTGAQTVLLSQSNDNPTTVDRDSEFTYSLDAYNNSGLEVENYIIEDILPYNKDSRGSDFNGSYEVKVDIPASQSQAKLYCTTKDSKTITGNTNSSDDGFEECTAGSYVSATAIRITGIHLNNGETMDSIKVTLKTKNNKFGDKYVNSFIGGNNKLKDKKSNVIDYNVISRTISGTIFYDSNEDGIRNENEVLVSGLTVILYKIDSGNLVEAGKTSVTNKNGEYSFTNLDAGFYKVRIEYNSGSYDLTLRYASENRSIDSDAYKIKEGLAEISGKNAPGTVDGIDLTVFENSKAENMDMGLIPRVSFGFEMKKYITQVDLNYNNAINTTKYNNESIVSLNVRNTLNASAKVYYGIAIKNVSTQSGYVKLIQEDIPDGLIFDETDPYNKDWFKVGGVLQCNKLSDRVMEPGDTAYLQIALTMPNRETGNTFVNTVSMLDIETYIPQELAKEAEFKTDTYNLGEQVSYAGVDWHVVGIKNISEDEQDITILADSGTIKDAGGHIIKMNHTDSGIYKWGESKIKDYINSTWLNTNSINAPILRDQVVCNDPSSLDGTSYGGTLAEEGTCTTNDFVTTKVRLLTYNEYRTVKDALQDPSWLYTTDFWLMNTVNSEIQYDYYGKQSNEGVNLLGVSINAANTRVDIPANTDLEVRPVITVSSKNIIGQNMAQ